MACLERPDGCGTQWSRKSLGLVEGRPVVHRQGGLRVQSVGSEEPEHAAVKRLSPTLCDNIDHAAQVAPHVSARRTRRNPELLNRIIHLKWNCLIAAGG